MDRINDNAESWKVSTYKFPLGLVSLFGVIAVAGIAAIDLTANGFELRSVSSWVAAAAVTSGLGAMAQSPFQQLSVSHDSISVPRGTIGTRQIPLSEVRHAYIHRAGQGGASIHLRLVSGEIVTTPIADTGGAQPELEHVRDRINSIKGLPPGQPAQLLTN